MTHFAASTLQTLPDPTIIEPLDYEPLFKQLKSELINLAPELTDALSLESEPATKLLQVMAYRILHERKRTNDHALALMLAKARGNQLDQLGSLPFINTLRKVITPADPETIPPTAAVLENDEEYRLRLHIALEGFSTAGPAGAYIYHGLAAHKDVSDIAVEAPTFIRLIDSEIIDQLPKNAIVLVPENAAGLTDPLPGDVAITILSRHGDGTPSNELITAVETALNNEKIRPVTDRPRCRAANIITYQVIADIWYYPDANPELLLNDAKARTQAYVTQQQRIGHDVTCSGLHAAIHCPGVQRVELRQPAQDLVINNQHASYCTNITLTNQGIAV